MKKEYCLKNLIGLDTHSLLRPITFVGDTGLSVEPDIFRLTQNGGYRQG